MFYSESVLTSRGPLAKIWIASHMERKLTKQQFLQTSIESSLNILMTSEQPPIALRLSGQLLLGVVKIYYRKARYLLEDCTDTISKIKSTFIPNKLDLPNNTDKQRSTTVASTNTLTLSDGFAGYSVFVSEPEFDLETLISRANRLEPSITAEARNITLSSGTKRSLYSMEEDNNSESNEFMFADNTATLEELLRTPARSVLSVEQARDAQLSMAYDNTDLGISREIFEDQSFGGEGLDHPFSVENIENVSYIDNNNKDPTLSAAVENNGENKPEALKKRRILIDKITEIPPNEYFSQIRDTSDIISKEARNMKRIDEKMYLDLLINPAKSVPQLQRLFSNSLARESEILSSGFAMQTPEKRMRESILSTTSVGHDQLGSFDETPAMESYDMPNIVAEGSESKHRYSIIEQPEAFGLEPSVLFRENVKELYMLNENTQRQNTAPADDQEIQNSTIRAIGLIKENISNEEKSVHFDSIAGTDKVKANDAARFFYELLVLSNKGFVSLQQSSPYDDIIIKQVGTKLDDYGAAHSGEARAADF